MPDRLGTTKIVAELETPDALVGAARRMYARGVRAFEAFAPYHVEGLEDALGIRRTRIPVLAFAAAVTGAADAYLTIWFCNAYDYPIDVGGRPLNSVPTDVQIMFEIAVLFASFATFFACIMRSRLPRLHSTMSDVEGFERASIDRFWLAIDATDPAYDDGALADLTRLGARVRVVGGEA